MTITNDLTGDVILAMTNDSINDVTNVIFYNITSNIANGKLIMKLMVYTGI